LTVAIEDVYQLHNTSAILRSCDVFGVQTLHVVEDRFENMGAEQWVDVKRHTSSANCITSLKHSGYEIVATTPHETSHTLESLEINSVT